MELIWSEISSETRQIFMSWFHVRVLVLEYDRTGIVGQAPAGVPVCRSSIIVVA